MRTNIVLDDDLLLQARKYSKAKSKRALLEESLRVFIQTKAAEARTASYMDRLRTLDRKLAGVRLHELPLHVLREARDRT